MCRSCSIPCFRQRFDPPLLFYGSGWFACHPSTSAGSSLQSPAHSSLPTSKLRIPLQVGAGDIGIYYLDEPVFVVGKGSPVECWVNDNYGGARVVENAADVGEPTPRIRPPIVSQYLLAHISLNASFTERKGQVYLRSRPSESFPRSKKTLTKSGQHLFISSCRTNQVDGGIHHWHNTWSNRYISLCADFPVPRSLTLLLVYWLRW